jgi:hypothetical protein
MDNKIDFDILLTTIQSANDRQDVALVSGIYNTAQQIKNVVLMSRSDNAFNYSLGTDINSFLSGNMANAWIAVDTINTSVTYAVKDVYNIKTKIVKDQGTLVITIKFDYKTKTAFSPNNAVTITMDTNI